jgi:SSS family solute:Na+ symporter
VVLTWYASVSGGADYVRQLVAEGDLLMRLVRPMDDASVPWLGMIVGIPVLGLFFWGNNQQLVQRVLTAKSVDEGRKGVLFVGLLTIITLGVIIIPGVMAKELFPGLERPDMVYPNMIINLLPNALIGFLLAAMVAGSDLFLERVAQFSSDLVYDGFLLEVVPGE